MAQEKTLCFYNLSFFLLPSSSCGVNTALSVYPKCHITVYALNPSVMDVCLCELEENRSLCIQYLHRADFVYGRRGQILRAALGLIRSGL